MKDQHAETVVKTKTKPTLRQAIAIALGKDKSRGDSDAALDAVHLDHARARHRQANRDRAAAERRVARRRARERTETLQLRQITAGQSAVLAGQGVRGPLEVSEHLVANVHKDVVRKVTAREREALIDEGKPREGTRDFDRTLKRNVKARLAEAGL